MKRLFKGEAYRPTGYSITRKKSLKNGSFFYRKGDNVAKRVLKYLYSPSLLLRCLLFTEA
ncbi:MAG: hypothetical protein LBJ00_18480 [Planctomycetaceae bacterium]|nr:hypothetical protein [Planctomycetaceae bacterium]